MVLLQPAAERVPCTLIRCALLILSVKDKFLEGIHGGGGAVQRNKANGGRRSGLVSQRLGNLEVVERWRPNGPRVAEDSFLIAVNDGEFRRVGSRGEERK